MKKVYLFFLLIAVASITVFSQVPNAFNYQAVVRNSSGEIIANKTVSFRISLLKNSETGTVAYSETHSLSTNEFGLVNFKIGKGTKISGTFSPSDWGEVIFTKVEFDPAGGSSFSELATTKLSSVPFAFVAQTVVNDKVDDADADPANEIQTITKSGSTLTLSKGGGSVTLPSTGGGDDWGAQTVKTDATLSGNGTTANPLSIVGDLTDDQTLSLSGNNLTIEGGNTVTLPESNSPWQDYSSDGIYYEDGPIGIGTSARYDNNLFAVVSSDKTAIYAHNSSDRATLYSANSGGGPAAFFEGPVKIKDGTQGNGKVLTSDANGIASWQSDLSVNDLTANGDVFINQNLEVADDMTVGSVTITAGELTKSTTGTSNNLLPFAYGTITNTGGKIGCTSNVSTVTRHGGGQYSVHITNLGTDYTVVITPYGLSAYITGAVIRYTDFFNGLIWDTKNDKYYDGGFSFIVYKP